MNSKTITKLLIALVVLGGIAWFTQRETTEKEENSTGISTGDEVLAALELNDVTSISITGPEGTNSVANKDGSWVVDSLHNFPADFEKVRDNLVAFSKTKVGDVPRGGSDEEYGLGDKATTVSLNGADGKALATIQMGEARQRKGSQFGGADGHYVKIDDSPVLLVDSDFGSLPKKSEDWITKDLLNVQSADITEIAITGTNGTVTLDTKNSSAYVVNGLSEEEETTTANAGRAHRALQNLRFNSVADPSRDAAATGLDKPSAFVAKTKEGITYIVHVGNEVSEGDRYAQINATYTAPAAPTQAEAEAQVPPDPEPKPEEAKPEGQEKPESEAPAPEKSREEKVAEKLASLTTAHEKKVKEATEKVEALAEKKEWVYVVDSLDVEPLVFNRSDLVSIKKEGDEAAPGSASAPPPGIGLPPGIGGLPPGIQLPPGLGAPPPGIAAPPPGIAAPPRTVTTPPVKVAPPKRTVTTPPVKVEAPKKTVTSPPVKVEPPKPKTTVTSPPVKIEPPKIKKITPPPVPDVKKATEGAAKKIGDTVKPAPDAGKQSAEKAQQALQNAPLKLKLKVGEKVEE